MFTKLQRNSPIAPTATATPAPTEDVHSISSENGIGLPMLDEVVKQNASNLYYFLDYSLGFFISCCTLIFLS